jgi:hypothetical protein
LEDPYKGAGLDRSAIDALKNDYLVRPEQRRGVTWYELAHDRLIEPVMTNNKKWFEQNLSTFQKQAALWVSRNRVGGLLTGEALRQEEAWLREHPEVKLTPEDNDFLEACRKEDYARKRSRAVAKIVLFLFVVALIAVGFAVNSNRKLEHQRKQLEENQKKLEATSLAFDELQRHNAEVELAAEENGKKLPTDPIDDHPPFPAGAAGRPVGVGAKAQGADPSAAGAGSPAPPAKGGITITLGSKPDPAAGKNGGINITLGSNNSDITVRYFQKDADQDRVKSVLSVIQRRYNTEITPSVEALADVPTNCIWYGAGVSIEDAKIVALRLVAAGIQIKAIKPMRSPKEKTRDIEVGGERSWLYSKPLTVDEIRKCQGQCPANAAPYTAN